MPYTTTLTKKTTYFTTADNMCFRAEPSRAKYYYHEEYIPVRHHQHHQHRTSAPRVSYHSGRHAHYSASSPRVSSSSHRHSGPLVYERTSTRYH